MCISVPEKVCKDRTIETPRQVCHTEHNKIVDTTITEHCEETITTKCEQVSSQTRHSSGVVGHDSKVVATGIVASPEVTVSHGIAAHGVRGAGYGAVATGALVGADTRVGPEAAVAHHGTIAVAAHAHVAGPVVAGGVVAAGYGAGYGAGLVGGVVGHAGPVVAGYAGTGAGLAGYAAW